MAFRATRPTRAMSAICAMPWTTVQKMMGAISMRIALMKASPNGCIWAPRSGRMTPSRMPIAMAIRTCTHSSFHQAFERCLSMTRVAISAPTSAAAARSVELEQPRGIAHQDLLLQLRLRRKQRHQVDQVAVIRHHLDVGMRPIGAPDHPIGRRLDDLARVGHRVRKGRTGRRDALAAADLDPAFLVALHQLDQGAERKLVEAVGRLDAPHMIDGVAHRDRKSVV